MASLKDRKSISFPGCVLIVIFFSLFSTQSVKAQSRMDSVHVAQISGKVITAENNNPVGIPYAVVAVVGTHRGTFTDFNGFFSIVVRNGETLVFSVLGFKDAYYHVPDTLSRDRYTLFRY
ncbi:MAG: carboxypeptidase-like regulatory domain-containing protein [Saprospiraceae bacterium]|uniref:Carboxypeptidase-like regulatory domain-containing protein n=1 Tax=Candidatus Opimibacter skivensis TaxID=2982028 RepID=A0A9D7XS70_9BACT|nr:carboxypeptidase-like regulatory domain-containing protein [Candidatus Opimibacter skivensis]